MPQAGLINLEDNPQDMSYRYNLNKNYVRMSDTYSNYTILIDDECIHKKLLVGTLLSHKTTRGLQNQFQQKKYERENPHQYRNPHIICHNETI